MKKVLFFLESLAGGGAEKVLSDLVSNIDKKKYDVMVLTITDEGVYEDKVRQSCRYESLLKNKDYRGRIIKKIIYWMKMKLIYMLPPKIVYRFIVREKYDIEVAFIEGFATKLIASSTNQKSMKLAWVHTDMIKNPHADVIYKSVTAEGEAYKKFDQILCVSAGVKDAFETKFFRSDKVSIQYNLVDSKLILQGAMEEIDIEPNPVIQLGTVGRLEQEKGYVRLVESAARLKQQGYELGIWIIGEGSQRSKLEALIRKNKLESCVKLIGFQNNPYKYLSKCDCFICSSYSEGFSTAATESLILGNPVFTVKCAGMEELFDSEKCGDIVDNTDDALYIMLERLVSKSVCLCDYVDAVKRRAEVFSIDKRMKEIEKLLG